MFKKGLIEQKNEPHQPHLTKNKARMSNSKRLEVSHSPATFSHPELLKMFKKFNRNSPTSVDTNVELPNIEVQE